MEVRNIISLVLVELKNELAKLASEQEAADTLQTAQQIVIVLKIMLKVGYWTPCVTPF